VSVIKQTIPLLTFVFHFLHLDSIYKWKICENASKVVTTGSITIAGKKIRKDSRNWIELTITDTGIGIPESKLTVIFEPFEQVGGLELIQTNAVICTNLGRRWT
jgi:signal transduction histidine kinase